VEKRQYVIFYSNLGLGEKRGPARSSPLPNPRIKGGRRMEHDIFYDSMSRLQHGGEMAVDKRKTHLGIRRGRQKGTIEGEKSAV